MTFIKITVTPLATPTINATLSRLSAPFINSWVNIFSFILVTIAISMDEPRNSADISVVHHFKNITPPIIERNVSK